MTARGISATIRRSRPSDERVEVRRVETTPRDTLRPVAWPAVVIYRNARTDGVIVRRGREGRGRWEVVMASELHPRVPGTP